MAKHVIITGATGMVGKGVLLECLESDVIDKITVIGRSSIGMQHQKLNELLLPDLLLVETLAAQMGKPDACFHCMGVSAVGLSELEYTSLTLDITKALADTCYSINAEMVFNYVSGTGTDSTEQGRSMWARVKGRTENYVLQKGFANAYMFRPGAIIPEKGITSRTGWYNFFYTIMRPLFPLFKKSKNVTTTTKLGAAMINTLFTKPQKLHLENKDINWLATANQ